MMGTDGRDRATCQKSKRRDIDVILEIINDSEDKIANSGLLLLQNKRLKRVGGGGRCSGYGFFVFRE